MVMIIDGTGVSKKRLGIQWRAARRQPAVIQRRHGGLTPRRSPKHNRERYALPRLQHREPP